MAGTIIAVSRSSEVSNGERIAGTPDVWGQEPMTYGPEDFRLVLGALDHEWRFSEISPDATTWFGWNPAEYRGTALQSVVHPEDAPLLLLALGRAGVDRRGVATVVRVRSEPAPSSNGSSELSSAASSAASSTDGVWVPVRCEVSPLCDHNPPRFAVAMWVLDAGRDTESPEQRAARLEDHLWRIAVEIAAAGIGDAPASGEMWWSDPALRELSQRQLEILRRLLRGERVPMIARDLFLSQSTVRNHLSAIYRRRGLPSPPASSWAAAISSFRSRATVSRTAACSSPLAMPDLPSVARGALKAPD